jgi:hypothetical protein
MYFHGAVMLAGNKFLCFTNESEDYILRYVVIPFINGQVVESNNKDENSKRIQVLVNMKSAVSLSIYKTNDVIDEDDFFVECSGNRVSEKYTEFDCTSEFVEKVRELQANPNTKSLLEMAFAQQQKQAFIVMKFGDELLDSAYEGVIKPLIEEFGLACVRVDEIQDAGKINDQILENIAKSCLVISDLSGERPNCYYETGFAHALGKNIILTIHRDSDIHFDLSGNRFIQWGTEKELRDQLRGRLNSIFPNTN